MNGTLQTGDAASAPAGGRRQRTRLGLSGRAQWVLLVLAVYLLLTLILTYPLALHLTTRIPGSNVDEGAFLWNTWWFKSSLIDRHTNPFFADVMFYPLGVSTVLYTMAWLNCALSLPITLLAGPIPATNSALLLAFALSGFGGYLLALDRLCVSGRRGAAARPAAFIAGLVYAFVSLRLHQVIGGEYNFVSSEWMPFTVMYILRTVERPGRRAPLLAAVFALLAAWTEMNFVVYLLVFVLTVLAFGIISHSIRFGRALVARGLAALLVFAIGFAPLGAPVVIETLTSGAPLNMGWGAGDLNVIDLLGPLLPSTLHPLFGVWARQATRQFSWAQYGATGYTLILLAIAGALSGRRQARRGEGLGPRGARLWSVVAAVFFLFALGPLLHINGRSIFDLDGLKVTVPLPFIIIHYIPFLTSSRYSFRFFNLAIMAAGILAAFACYALLSRLKRRGAQVAATVVVSSLILFENLGVPLLLNNAVPPEPYRIIAQDPGDFAILHVPMGWRDGFRILGLESTLVQSYQTVHEKRIMDGNTSRMAGQMEYYFTHAPVITSLLNYEEGRTEDPAIIAGDRALAPSVLSFLDVRYIVVNGDFVGAAVDTYIQDVLPVERVAEGTGQDESARWHLADDGRWVEMRTVNTGWVLYKVRPNPAGPPLAIDLGTNSGHLHQASGWSYDEAVGGVTLSWVDGKMATALLRLDQPAAATLSLRAMPFSYAGAPQQQMQVTVNGHRVADLRVQDGWGEYSMDVPASYVQAGMNRIGLALAYATSPAQALGTSDRRTLSIAVDWIKMAPKP